VDALTSNFMPTSLNFMNETVRRRFRVGAIILAVTAFVVVANSMAIIWMFNEGHKETENTAVALRNHVEGDMMHDAINSSVLRARLAAATGDARAAEEAAADLKRYAAWFERLIAENKKLGLPPQIQKTLAKLDGPLKAYVAEANAVQLAHQNGSQAAQRLTASFDKQFEEMEEAMLAVSNELEAELRASRSNNERRAFVAWAVMAGIAIIFLAVIAFAYRVIVRDVIAPLESQTSSLFALSRGETDVEVVGEDRRDELGRLAQGIVAFRNATSVIREAGEARKKAEDVAHEASGVAEMETAKREQMQALAVSMEQRVLGVVDQLAEQVRDQLKLAESIAESADRTRSEIMVASGTGSQIVDSMNQVATATAQLAMSSTNIGEVVHETIKRTLSAADRSAEAASKADALIDSINQIRSFSQLISDVARQTNQLALNARIEASRAGEAGESFAVVATEIKALANNAAVASATIVGKLSSIEEIAGAVMDSIADVNESVAALRDASTIVAESIEEQNLATGSIDQSIQEVATGTRDLGNMVNSVESLANSGLADSDKLKAQAALLDHLAVGLRVDVTKVIGEVRSS
jgi:methyl-accepting chemotaxis protein